ncbi:MAG: hypothetical protein ACTS9Y_07775 [Methylophilus sp.]|uniref:hypothetical protein n=1 Tax=Methylophilus sp. TaxID=29541 RepID=UPI003FA0018E
MSQADSVGGYRSGEVHNGPTEVRSGVSLASVTVGIIAALLFLLISSYVSNDANWNIPSDRAWVSTSLTGNDLSGNAWETPVPEKVKSIQPQSQKDEAAHFSDALYSADFMNSFAEPT